MATFEEGGAEDIPKNNGRFIGHISLITVMCINSYCSPWVARLLVLSCNSYAIIHDLKNLLDHGATAPNEGPPSSSILSRPSIRPKVSIREST